MAAMKKGTCKKILGAMELAGLLALFCLHRTDLTVSAAITSGMCERTQGKVKQE